MHRIANDMSPYSAGSFLLFSELFTIRYPLSAIRYPLSAIRYPLSAIRYPLSAIRYPLSDVDNRLRNRIRRLNHLRIRLEVALRGDHVDELRGDVDVRCFESTGLNQTEA